MRLRGRRCRSSASLILKHDLRRAAGRARHLPAQTGRRSAIVFWSFRIMVGLGLLMFALGLWSLLARGCAASSTTGAGCTASRWSWGRSGFVAVICRLGDDRGRPPALDWSTACCAPRDAVSPIAAPAVAASLIAFVIVYFAVFGAGTLYMLRLMAARAAAGATSPASAERARSAAPASRRRRRSGAAGERAMAERGSHHHLGLHHRLRGGDVCGDGRVRSRHRHPVSRASRSARSATRR